MVMKENSLVSTDEIEMRFVPYCAEDYDFNYRYRLKYFIRLKNKTDHLIYIDRANCFRKNNTDAATAYYDTKQVSISQGTSSGIGIGVGISNDVSLMGGIGSSATQSTLYSQQRFISIPPYSEVNLTEYVYDAKRKVKTIFTDNYAIINDIETWHFPIDYKNYMLYYNGVLECSEENSPYKCEYQITYSSTPDFSNYSILTCQMYARYLVGRDYYKSMNVFSFEQIQKYISNFKGKAGEADIIIGQPQYIVKTSLFLKPVK